MLGRSKDLPLGAFMNKQGKICTIRGKNMEKSMPLGCECTYPNTAHYLRQHIKRLMSHSIRVFACIALKNAGVSEEHRVPPTMELGCCQILCPRLLPLE